VETAEAVDLFIENWYLETDVFLHSSENILYVLMGRFTQFSTYNYTIVASSGRGISINMRKILDIEKYGRTQRVLEAGITSDPPYQSMVDHDEWVSLQWPQSITQVKASRIVRVMEETEYRFFVSTAPYPVAPSLFGAPLSEYLESTNLIQANDQEIRRLAETLTTGSKTQMEASLRIIG